MLVKRIKLTFFTAVAVVCSITSATAESFNYRYDVRFGPAKIGEMQVAASNNGQTYSATSVLATTGVVGALYDVRYEYSVTGKVGRNDQLMPMRYAYVGDEQGRNSSVEISYTGDRVSKVIFIPQRAIPEDATTHRGTVDVMSLIYLLLRPVRAMDACKGSIDLFDGRNRNKVVFKDVERLSNGRIGCNIAYSSQRGGGLTPSTLIFVPEGEGMVRVKEFEAHTSIGRIVVTSQ